MKTLRKSIVDEGHLFGREPGALEHALYECSVTARQTQVLLLRMPEMHEVPRRPQNQEHGSNSPMMGCARG